MGKVQILAIAVLLIAAVVIVLQGGTLFSNRVNPYGVALMLAGLVAFLARDFLAAKMPERLREKGHMALQFAALALAIVGASVAMFAI